MESFFAELPLVVSYYTKNTPYENEVKYLEESCKKYRIESHIEGLSDKGTWEENCAIKPYFMRDKMKEFKRPLLWVDADAVFLQPLRFEEFMFAPLAIHNNEKAPDLRLSVNAATVYVNAKKEGMQALDLWCHYADKIQEMESKAPAFMDQVSLYYVLLSRPAFPIAQIPLTYCKIFDRESNEIKPEDIVIEQRQASRRFKKNN